MAATLNTAPDPASLEQQQQEMAQAAPASPSTPWYKWLPHPITAIFTVIFKLLALLVYLLLYWITKQFVVSFVVVIIFIAFDFWTMKNVSGRMLVGLRWWNEVLEDGTSKWRFECLPESEKGRLNKVEIITFWGSLIIFPVLWVGCFVLAVARLPPQVDWAVLCAIAVVISASNVFGYIKCARGARAQVKQMMKTVATKAVVAAATASISNQ